MRISDWSSDVCSSDLAVAGIALGALLASVRGNGMGIVAFGFQTLVGIGLFVGMVATTGTVHVYDRVRNAYQPVGDVPNLIVLVAGVTNMMERAIAETIDDNTIDPNRSEEHTSELQSLMRISYAVFFLKKK